MFFVSECIVRRKGRPGPAGVFGEDGAGVDPAGLPVAVRPVALGVLLLLQKSKHKAPVEALPPQTGKHAPQQDANGTENRTEFTYEDLASVRAKRLFLLLLTRLFIISNFKVPQITPQC